MTDRHGPVKSHLERLITRHARETAIAPDRVRRWVSTMVMLGALDRGGDEDGPRFLLKGGVAIELRLRARARATTDVDLIFRGERRDLLDALDTALRDPYRDFTFQRTAPAPHGPHAQRLDIRLAYQSRAWATLRAEISGHEPGTDEHDMLPAIDLHAFQLEGPSDIACLPLRWQIAQKLHAVSAPSTAGRENTRFRDLADLLLLTGLITDLPALRRACQATFSTRDAHPWPPTLTAPASWNEPYAALAASLGLDVLDAQAATQEVNGLVAQIASA